LSHEITTWQDFEILFKKTFRTETSFSQRFAQMQSRIQNKGEAITAYFHNKVRRCKAVNLNFEDIKEQVLIGLSLHDLARSLLVAKHADEDELLADIMAFERIQKRRADIHVVDKPGWRPKLMEEFDKGGPKTVGNPVNDNTSSNQSSKSTPITRNIRTSSTFKCWNCQKMVTVNVIVQNHVR